MHRRGWPTSLMPAQVGGRTGVPARSSRLAVSAGSRCGHREEIAQSATCGPSRPRVADGLPAAWCSAAARTCRGGSFLDGCPHLHKKSQPSYVPAPIPSQCRCTVGENSGGRCTRGDTTDEKNCDVLTHLYHRSRGAGPAQRAVLLTLTSC